MDSWTRGTKCHEHGAMAPTGVILLALPRLAHDLMSELVNEQSDLRLLGTVGNIGEAQQLARKRDGPVTIVAGDRVTDDDVAAALFALPHLRVVIFDRGIRSGRLCQLEARCR